MQPFFFGTSEKSLFGLYHPAQGNSARHGGIVLCPPFGPEYIRAHRSLRELGHRLAEAGFHVLRFDFYGCGDSAGASEDADLEQWEGDVSAAMEEVRETSGIKAVSLLGLRFGASLAAIAGSRRADVERLVLWDPIVNGERYLAELADRHRAFFESRPKPRQMAEGASTDEALGFPLAPRLRREMEAFDLLAISRSPARRTLLLSTDGSPGTVALRNHLDRIGADTTYQHMPGSKVWLKEEDEISQAVVPQATLTSIASWLTDTER
jgi:uncharacterized protein